MYNICYTILYYTYTIHIHVYIGDTSQHGNWTFFRNELFNKEPFVVTPGTYIIYYASYILTYIFIYML